MRDISAVTAPIDGMDMISAASNLEGAVAACGSVTVSTNDLVDARAFKHRDHPLALHADAFAAATGCGDSIWDLREIVWRNLIISHVVPTLDVSVQLAIGSYNSAYSRFVDGLTNNEHALQMTDVIIPAEAVEAAFAAAAVATSETYSVPTAVGVATRVSTLSSGITALVGRRVEVTFCGAVEGIVGQMIAIHPDALVIAASEEVTVVPLGAVAYVTTFQLTDDEDRALFD